MPAPLILQLPSFLPYRLSIAANLVSDVIATAYDRRFGLSIPEWRVLAIVAMTRSANQQEICTVSRMDKMTVSRATAALYKRGLLERQANPDDGRSHLLALSRSGRTLYARVVPKALELEDRIFGRFSAEERALLQKLLTRIESAALAVAPD